MSKRYQFFWAKALKTYFEAGRKLMKPSDIFGVPIDTDSSRHLFGSKAEHSYMEGDLRLRFISTSFAYSVAYLLNLSQLARPCRFNEVIFFKVTNIEYDMMPQPESFNPDFYRSSTLGELGCWVDSTITRIIQAGLEHSRVPDTRSYMQLGSHRSFY